MCSPCNAVCNGVNWTLSSCPVDVAGHPRPTSLACHCRRRWRTGRCWLTRMQTRTAKPSSRGPRESCGQGRQSHHREVPARADEAGTMMLLFDHFRMVVVALVVFWSYWVGNMFGICESRRIGSSGVIHQTQTSGIWACLWGRGKSATTGTSPEDGNPQ